MKIEEQVCSLELAKCLKELGVKQESHFYYEWYSDSAYSLGHLLIEDYAPGATMISAFNVSELGEMLPFFWDSGKRIDDYICRVFEKNVSDTIASFGSSEADARAKMLIYLIENGLINSQGEKNATSQRKEGEQ